MLEENKKQGKERIVKERERDREVSWPLGIVTSPLQQLTFPKLPVQWQNHNIST
jgi:hypothetical protein